MIKENLESITSKLPPEVKLVAVSKFHPLSAIMEAYGAGQRIFAESRPQELSAKVAELASTGAATDIEWHFIGHLQTNKLKMVLPHVSLVHSVDSMHLLQAIDAWGKAAGRTTEALLEMHVAMEEAKQGFYEEELLELAFRLSDGLRPDGTTSVFPNVRIRGLMAMATNTDDLEIIRSDFDRVRQFRDYLGDVFPELVESGMDQLSLGMSSDWETALEYGTTMVRIGTSIFGERQY